MYAFGVIFVRFLFANIAAVIGLTKTPNKLKLGRNVRLFDFASLVVNTVCNTKSNSATPPPLRRLAA